VVRSRQTIEIHAPADEVWRRAGRPERIADFHPDVELAVLDVDLRTCVRPDARVRVERILEHSPVHRFYTYELAFGDGELRRLRACFAVRGHGDHSHVDWDVELEAERPADEHELARRVDEEHRLGLERLRAQLELERAAA